MKDEWKISELRICKWYVKDEWKKIEIGVKKIEMSAEWVIERWVKDDCRMSDWRMRKDEW